MNICFEAEKDNEKLNKFLKNWENPINPMTIASNSTFAEFKVTKIKELIIITQQNIFDVWAKFLVYGGTGLMLFAVLLQLINEHSFYPTLWFNVGLGITFLCILWLSPYYRYFLMKIKLRSIGYKGKLEYVNNSYALSKLLYELENESK